MFNYYFGLALRSLRRNPVLTALMVVTIGVGIGASMTTLTVFRAMDADPMPHKSRQLFVPQIDNWGPNEHAAASGGPGAREVKRTPNDPSASTTARFPNDLYKLKPNRTPNVRGGSRCIQVTPWLDALAGAAVAMTALSSRLLP